MRSVAFHCLISVFYSNNRCMCAPPKTHTTAAQSCELASIRKVSPESISFAGFLFPLGCHATLSIYPINLVSWPGINSPPLSWPNSKATVLVQAQLHFPYAIGCHWHPGVFCLLFVYWFVWLSPLEYSRASQSSSTLRMGFYRVAFKIHLESHSN